MKLIETKRKEKLPKGFSYPTNAQFLSEALTGIPQFDEMRLWFSWRDIFWTSKYRAKLAKAGEIEIVQIAHAPMFSATWSVRCHAVPSDHAARAKELLAAEDWFADARRRLISHTDVGDRFQWALRYDLGTETLSETST